MRRRIIRPKRKGRSGREQRGYALIVVFVLLTVVASAGAFALTTLESNVRSTTRMTTSRMLIEAANAGAMTRLSQIAVATDDAGAAIDAEVEPAKWPPPGMFNTADDIGETLEYHVESDLLVVQDGRPPPGIQIDRGGQTAIFKITSYAVEGEFSSGGEHAVSVGVKLYARAGLGYND